MCLWLLAACLNAAAAPRYPYYVAPIVSGIPGPILVPTASPPTLTPVPTFPPNTFPTVPPNTFPTVPPNTFPTGPPNTFPTVPPNTFPTVPPNTFPTGPPNTFPTGPPNTFPPNTFPTLPPGVTTPTTRPTLTPFPGGNTPGITLPPGGIIPTQQSIPTIPPFPNIDPRGGPPLPLTNIELVKFGGIDYEDVVVEAESLGNGIQFPRDKRSTESESDEEEDDFSAEEISGSSRSNRTKRQTNCGCYLPAQCPATGNTDGTGIIDFRIVVGGGVQPQNCAAGLRYCCIGSSPQQSCGSRLQATTVYPVNPGQARYGDYPWMAVILTMDNQYVGGATLIDSQNVITVAHRITNYPNGAGIKIRLGEWDAAANYEQYPYRDFNIARVWVHEAFNPGNLQNDLALIRLVGGLPAGTPAIIPICMPTMGQLFDGQRCWVSGWGKDNFGPNGRYQTILKAVDVPVISSATCETTMRTTRLGTAFVLDRNSFICAGGEVNKDSCTGDGGSGMVCETTPGRWTLAGLVAWGLGCATQGVPAAYVNIANYLPWIQSRQATPA